VKGTEVAETTILSLPPAFRDARFMSELDVVFANMYFAAIAAGDVDPSRAPSAWRPLLRVPRNCGIPRLQFAPAGMNAHINRDLPQGIVLNRPRPSIWQPKRLPYNLDSD
jgi:hypothetical protein